MKKEYLHAPFTDKNAKAQKLTDPESPRVKAERERERGREIVSLQCLDPGAQLISGIVELGSQLFFEALRAKLNRQGLCAL